MTQEIIGKMAKIMDEVEQQTEISSILNSQINTKMATLEDKLNKKVTELNLKIKLQKFKRPAEKGVPTHAAEEEETPLQLQQQLIKVEKS